MKYYNIPLFVPHKGCPNDCVFCNQKKITAENKPVTAECVDKIISDYLKTLPKEAYIEAAFFGGSFTGIPLEEQDELLSVAKKYYDAKKINGIRLSTRPDYINKEILDLLREKSVTTIELGVQSMNEEVLIKSNRGHSKSDVIAAVNLIKAYGFNLGLQMMTGLPGDTFSRSIDTAKEFIELKPDFVRIYPTLVIRNTALCDMYENGSYKPQTVDEAVKLCKILKTMFTEHGINVIRVSLQTTEEISQGASVVAGPFHPAFGELVENELYYDELLRLTKELKNCKIKVGVKPTEISKLIGNGGINKKRIKIQKNIDLQVIGIENSDSKIKLIKVE